ncbi:MAG: type I pullulanase [Clostridia bacterium]|nr:type I pullulanase [Clostridia bacterium]
MNNSIPEQVLNERYGVTLQGGQTQFCIWSPSSKKIQLRIYRTAGAVRFKTYEMVKEKFDIWRFKIEEDLEGQFYTYLIDDHYEIVDPYVHSANANSTKGAILDANTINPVGFLDHEVPKTIPFTQSILYELHVNDFSSGEEVPFENKGKYAAFTERGLTYKNQVIGIDHLIDLGITHVHLLPIYDFITVNDYDEKGYNWGYDPYLYNAPEGSYASDPDDPKCRILELKTLIQTLHELDIRVVLDVVYNHTYFGGTSNFHRLMPYVFHRTHEDIFYNGSGCGNELDTEHPYVGRFIIDSLKFWLNTYKVDGFRFDLMALYDINFVEQMQKELRAIKPDLILYGEPWTGGPSGLPDEKQFKKGKQKNIALFNDDFRNAIKGSNDGSDSGFVGHGKYRKDDVYAGCFGSISFSKEIIGFTKKASETINYVSSHDNLILMDKFSKAFPTATFEDKQNMNALSLSLILLSFGIPFLQAGTEFLRSKYGDHNSYKSSYHVNRIHWENKSKFRHVYDYVKTLIEFRKSQRVFELEDPEAIKKAITIVVSQGDVIHYDIESPFSTDYKKIKMVFNGGYSQVLIPEEGIDLRIDGALYYEENVKIVDHNWIVPKLSTAVFVSTPDKEYKI